MPESLEAGLPFGLEDAQKGGWSNTEWLHYRASGLTPEDTKALDDGTLSQREKDAQQSQIDAARELNKKGAKRAEVPEGRTEFVFDDAFCSRFKKATSLTEAISPAEEPKTINQRLDEQRDELAVLDKLADETYGFEKYKKDPRLKEIKELFSYSAAQLSSVFREAEDAETKFKCLRNIYAIENALWLNDIKSQRDELIDQAIRQPDLETLASIFSGEDFSLAFYTFGRLKPDPSKDGSGLPYFLGT